LTKLILRGSMKAKAFFIAFSISLLIAACGPKVNPPSGQEPIIPEIQPESLEETQPQMEVLPVKNVLCPEYYREEFGGTETTTCWQPLRPLIVVGNDRDKVTTGLTESGIKIKVDATNTYAYILYPGGTYTDVIVSAEVTSTGVNNHGAVLMCRATDSGWYEARVSTAGYFSVFKYEHARDIAGRNAYYDYVLDRPSGDIEMGTEKTNAIQLACMGDSLILTINGKEVFNRKVATDFTEPGLIGIGTLSFTHHPVSLIFNSITISKP